MRIKLILAAALVAVALHGLVSGDEQPKVTRSEANSVVTVTIEWPKGYQETVKITATGLKSEDAALVVEKALTQLKDLLRDERIADERKSDAFWSRSRR